MPERPSEPVEASDFEPVELNDKHEALLAELRQRSAATPSSQRPQRTRRRGVVRVLTTALAFTVLLGAAAIGTTGYEYHHLNSNITRVKNVLKPDDTSIIDAAKQLNAQNFLIIGSDSRAGDMASYGADVSGQRSDTTMLIHVSPDRTHVVGISIPRDSWVDIPACTGANGQVLPEHTGMFNSAITDGGPACTIATVQKLTGIEVTHYIDIDFDGFKAMVSAMGTVTICSPEAVTDPGSGLKLIKGNNPLNGEQALSYVRARETLGDGSDLERIKRQQRFLGAVMRQARSGSLLSNPLKLASFLEAATKAITLDSGTSFGDLQTLTSSLQSLDPSNVAFYTAPIKNANYTPPGTSMTGRVLLDPVVGSVLYGDVINDATMTVRTQTSVSATGTSVTTVAPSVPVTPSAGASTAPAATAPTATVTLPPAISGSDTSCTL